MERSGYSPFRKNVAAFRELTKWGDDEISAAVETIRARKDSRQDDKPTGYPDLRTPEWEIFSATQPPEVTTDFALRRDPNGVPAQLKGLFADVVQVERITGPFDPMKHWPGARYIALHTLSHLLIRTSTSTPRLRSPSRPYGAARTRRR